MIIKESNGKDDKNYIKNGSVIHRGKNKEKHPKVTWSSLKTPLMQLKINGRSVRREENK